MESDEELILNSKTEELPSSPVPERKLKRLKKSSVIFPDKTGGKETEKENSSEEPEDRRDSDASFDEENTDSLGGGFGLRTEDQTGEFNGWGTDLDGLGSDREEEEEKKKSGFDEENTDSDSLGEGHSSGEFNRGGTGLDGLGSDREEKKEEKEKSERSKRKKKRSKSEVDDGFLDESFGKIREGGKGRKERLRDLRAESQRLLRETRDASFKPVPLVQKSVSSVLEKIRQRKLEVSKTLFTSKRYPLVEKNNKDFRKVSLAADFEDSLMEVGQDDNVETADIEGSAMEAVGGENSVQEVSVENRSNVNTPNESLVNVGIAMEEDVGLRQTDKAPPNDTQDLIFDSQTSDSRDELPDESPSSPLEEVLAPSKLAMNLKFDSAPPDDSSSDEEDNDKENNDPFQGGSVGMPSSPKVDFAKRFLDDEAEEEDDSDNDLGRFQDDEEDEDNIDSDEFNDLIATGYDEKPIDKEMRNRLHQKWLEQQDAAGTENLLQRLKCRSNQREATPLREEEDEDSEECEEDFLEDAAEYQVTANVVRMNLKRAKEMIPHMFTDKDDVYLSSDEEETEKKIFKGRLSDKAGEHAPLRSPSKDEGSKDIFGLIKKLNGVQDTRKKAKITSSFHMLSIGGNNSAPSKSSFLGRGGKSYLPFQKHGSSTVRSFVFERDDSSSRSAISMSEDSSDLVENRPRKAATAKFSNSQPKLSTQNGVHVNSGPSLHEILKCPSVQSNNSNLSGMFGQVEAIYASFKLDRNVVKRNQVRL